MTEKSGFGLFTGPSILNIMLEYGGSYPKPEVLCYSNIPKFNATKRRKKCWLKTG
jgi:hypothetical protein